MTQPPNPFAFPDSALANVNYDPSFNSDFGMTLLDYFAGHALAGICAKMGAGHTVSTNSAKWAYDLADAMLEERAKRHV